LRRRKVKVCSFITIFTASLTHPGFSTLDHPKHKKVRLDTRRWEDEIKYKKRSSMDILYWKIWKAKIVWSRHSTL